MDWTPTGGDRRADEEEPQQPQPPLTPTETTPTGLPGEPAEPAEPDAWDTFVKPDVPEDDGLSEERTFVIAPEDDGAWGFGPPEPRGRACPHARIRGGWLTSLLLIILAVCLLAATAFGVWQYRQGVMTRNAAQQAMALLGSGAPQELTQRIADIQADLTAGRAELATQKIAELRNLLTQAQAQPPGGAPGAGAAPLPDEAFKDLPPDAATFFRQHQDMFRRFLEMCTIARELKEKGANVDTLRQMRDAVIEAARLGQLDIVQKKMGVMLAQLRKQTGDGGGPGGGQRAQLARKVQRLKEAAKRAEAQGRDIRPALLLMKKVEQSFAAGKMDEAIKYVDQALAAVRSAPRVGGGRGFGGDRRGLMLGGGRGGRVNPLMPFVRTLLGVMTAEEQNLKVVVDQLTQIRSVLVGESGPDTTAPATPPDSAQIETLKPMAERALAELKIVAMRRQELTRRANGPPGGKPLPQIGPRQRMSPDERHTLLLIILERLGAVLDRVRSLSDEEYAQQKAGLLREIVETVLRPTPPEQTTPAQTPTVFPKDPEQRVRAKMLEASKVLKQWELDGKDTKPVEALFAEARKALYDKKFDVAEQKVDEARKLLGLDQQPATGGGASSGATPPVDPSARLDLRGH